jgi:hypothetical protein
MVVQMRAFLIVLVALISSAQAQLAPPGPFKRPEAGLNATCAYSIRGYPFEVPAGVNLCWRAPFPYSSEYGLLHCDPKFQFQEITLVKRNDPRCERYEYRQ